MLVFKFLTRSLDQCPLPLVNVFFFTVDHLVTGKPQCPLGDHPLSSRIFIAVDKVVSYICCASDRFLPISWLHKCNLNFYDAPSTWASTFLPDALFQWSISVLQATGPRGFKFQIFNELACTWLETCQIVERYTASLRDTVEIPAHPLHSLICQNLPDHLVVYIGCMSELYNDKNIHWVVFMALTKRDSL